MRFLLFISVTKLSFIQCHKTIYLIDVFALCQISAFFADSYAVTKGSGDHPGKTESNPLVFNSLDCPIFETFALLAHAA